jgi:hypothetical protein
MQKSIAIIILQNKNTCLAYNHHFFEKQNRKKLFDNHIFSQPPMSNVIQTTKLLAFRFHLLDKTKNIV